MRVFFFVLLMVLLSGLPAAAQITSFSATGQKSSPEYSALMNELRNLKAQLAALQGEIDAQRRVIDALSGSRCGGTNNFVGGIGSNGSVSCKSMNLPSPAASASGGGSSDDDDGTAAGGGGFEGWLGKIYGEHLGREVDRVGAIQYRKAYEAGHMSKAEIEAAVANSCEARGTCGKADHKKVEQAADRLGVDVDERCTSRDCRNRYSD
ncbi:hypothetical protein CVT23_20985 [Minwuia thermotolerans]|uniref:DUF4214 domain-containing protein n=2 Tax=Minwuia thermotolerans TaxID=2056226 RepID=A0A2M9FW51_9PROT|nr:hypothetical protein CVT23_20985 [Minwuia thermotolerans]